MMDKIKKQYILLLIIFLVGLHLRYYHIDSPVCGYHNWKDEHYLGEARNFAREGFFKYGFFVPVRDFPKLDEDPSGAHSDTFPLVSILGALSFMLFGISLWNAKIITILASSSAVIIMYFLIKRAFGRADMALISAFLTAVLPLYVFYAHNFQLVNLGLPLMLLSMFFYMRWWVEEDNGDRKWCFIVSAFCLTLATMTKYSFLVAVIPMAFIFPFREWRKYWKLILSGVMIFMLFPGWYLYSSLVVAEKYSTVGGVSSYIQPEKILSSQWQKATEAYIKDNYTLMGFSFFIFGLCILLGTILFSTQKKGKYFVFHIKAFEIFLLGCFVATVLFVVIMAGKLGGHSYHHFPVAPFIVIFMSYFIVKVSDFAKRINIQGADIISLHVFVVLFLLLPFIPAFNAPVHEAISRQFDTQFFGLDVAGDYIRTHKQPNDRVMHSSHQAYGVLWHGDIKGTKGIPRTVEDMVFAEEALNASWIFIYQWDFSILGGTEVEDHIRENYRIVQTGYLRQEEITPLYLLLRKGGTIDMERLEEAVRENKEYKDYELTRGNVRMYYVDLE